MVLYVEFVYYKFIKINNVKRGEFECSNGGLWESRVDFRGKE